MFVFVCRPQLIEYVDKYNVADMDEYESNSSFHFYDLSQASWTDMSFDSVSRTVLFTANNDSGATTLPFLANGSLTLKASAAVKIMKQSAGC